MATTRYTKDHEWIRIENGSGVCGITDYAQKAMGDIVYVELPPLGKGVKKGEMTAVVESSKTASEVYAPIEGEVCAVNDALSAEPGTVNTDPLGKGWLFTLQPGDVAQLDQLMDETTYQNYVLGLLT